MQKKSNALLGADGRILDREARNKVIKADEKGTEQQALEINYDPEGLFKEVDETSVGAPQPRSVPVHTITSCGLPGARLQRRVVSTTTTCVPVHIITRPQLAITTVNDEQLYQRVS